MISGLGGGGRENDCQAGGPGAARASGGRRAKPCHGSRGPPAPGSSCVLAMSK